MIEKNKLREKMIQKLQQLTPTFRAKETALVLERLQEFLLPFDRKKIFLGAYQATQWECNINPITQTWSQQGGQLLYPRWNPKSHNYEWVCVTDPWDQIKWRKGKFNILEPDHDYHPYSGDMAIYLVPGVAFSPTGVRLGRGQGFFDRLLKKAHGYKVGIGYSIQLLEDLPYEMHDSFMDILILGEFIIYCNSHNMLLNQESNNYGC